MLYIIKKEEEVMKTINLEQLKENLDNDLVSYDDFVALVNKAYENDLIDINDFFNLMNDTLAESILYTDDIQVLRDYILEIRNNIEEEFKSDIQNGYTYEPSQDGGIFTESNILTDINLGILTNFLNVTVVAEIRIDLRPNCYSYVGVHVLNDNESDHEKKNLLGAYNYLHFEVNKDGSLNSPTLESM